MDKLLLTPYPAHVELTDDIAHGALYCAQSFDSDIMAGAADRFARAGALPVCFERNLSCEELRGYFDDPEGYIIEITQGGVRIMASADRGALYGAITLGHIARQYGDALPCGVIADKPVWRHRGAQISYAQMNVDYRDEYLRHFIRAMAELKCNTVYLYLEWRFQFPSIPETHSPAYMSPAQARALQSYAARYGITIVPALNVLGHTGDFLGAQAFHDLGEYDAAAQDARVADSAALCTSNPRTRALIEAALNDIMDAFDCEIIHVGGDEVEALGVCERCRAQYGDMDKASIYIDYYCWVRGILAARGRRMGIWSDMLLGFLKDGADMDKAKKLMEGTVIYDWRYDSAHTEAVELLAGAGADMILSTSVHGAATATTSLGQCINQRDYFADGFRFDVRGGLVTDWIYGHGYHGAQMEPLYASALALMWQGSAGEFVPGCTADDVFRAYAAQTYGADAPMPEYWHMSGDAQGEMLCRFKGGLSGSYLRRSAYLDDSPLGSFAHYAHALSGGALDEFRAALKRLEVLWSEIEAKAVPTPDLPFMKGGLVLYRYLAEKFTWAEELYEAYDAAAHVQYTDAERFRTLLMDAATKLRSHLPAFDEPLAFLTECRRVLGLEGGSILRLANTRANLMTLADFIEHLSDGHRPLPAFKNMNDYLFARPLTNFWAPRSDEWYAEPAPFTRTDGDNGREWGQAH